MLSMLEEIVLLAIDEGTGKLRGAEGYRIGYALAGAVFFDLALGKHIDTGTKDVQLFNAGPSGNEVNDFILKEMQQHPEVTTVRSWMEHMQSYGEYFEEAAIKKLIERGILKHEKSKLLWVIDVDRFPMVDDKPQRYVKLRLAQAVMGDAIPDSRDVMLLSLANVCGLLGLFLSEEELKHRRERIDVLCGLETISRTVADAIAELDQHIKSASIVGL
jgi:golgi phosphoprotein 3